MAVRFHPVIKQPRFEVPGYSPQQMITLGEALIVSVKDRLASGLDVYDSPAPPLTPAYAKFKAAKYPPAVRNWRLTGRTLGSLKVLEAGPNRAVIGFTDDLANMRAAINNARSRQFGVSPNDKQHLIQAINKLETAPILVKAAS